MAVVASEGVVASWCNPLTLQPEQSGGVVSSPGRTPPLEHHDKGSPVLGDEKRNFTFTRKCITIHAPRNEKTKILSKLKCGNVNEN